MQMNSTLGKGPNTQQEESPVDALKNFLKAIKGEMQGSPLLVGQGLDGLINEIITMIESGKAGGALLTGYFRELLLGYSLFREGNAVQFGLVGPDPGLEAETGAGGDITIFRAPAQGTIPAFQPPKDASEAELAEAKRVHACKVLSLYTPACTIQSKYITSAGPKIEQHITKAAEQLSGITGEMPYLKSERVISIVIEEPQVAQALFSPLASPNSIGQQIKDALDYNSQVNLWIRVDHIEIVANLGTVVLDNMDPSVTTFFQKNQKEKQESLIVICKISPHPESKTLTIGPFEKSEKRYRDFPYDFPLKGGSTLAVLINHYSRTLSSASQSSKVTQRATQPAKQSSSQAVAVVSVQLTEKAQALVQDIATKIQAKDVPQDYWEVVLPPILTAIGIAEPDCNFFLQVLKGGQYQSIQMNALNNAKSIVGQCYVKKLQQNPKGLLKVLQDARKSPSTSTTISSAPVTPEGRLDALCGSYPAYKALLQKTFSALVLPQAPAYVKNQVITNLEIIALHPYGWAACDFMTSDKMQRAWNSKAVLSQLTSGSDCTSTLGPLKFAPLLLHRQQNDPRYKGCILAFEYDENTPGMWQITRDHFDMDVGLIIEDSPLTVCALYQIKLVSDLDSVINEVKFAVPNQLQFPGEMEKGLVIFCPSNVPYDLYGWIYNAARDFAWYVSQSKARGITIELFFNDNVDNPHVVFSASDLWLLGQAMHSLESVADKLSEPLITEVAQAACVYPWWNPDYGSLKSLPEQIITLVNAGWPNESANFQVPFSYLEKISTSK